MSPRSTLTWCRTHLLNRERVRCLRFGTAARREEGEYPLWIFDRRASPKAFGPAVAKIRNPAGLSPGGPLAALLLSHRAPLAMLLRRALLPTRRDQSFS